MTGRGSTKTGIALVSMLVGLVLGLTVLAWFPVQADDVSMGGTMASRPVSGLVAAAGAVQGVEQTGLVYLPALFRYYPWSSPFGVEPRVSLKSEPWREQATDLRARWIRLNGRISWRLLQPEEGAPIDWTELDRFEDELRALKTAGMTPIVVVDDHPEWATIEAYGGDGGRSWCAAIRADKYGAFAQFMQALVARYKAPEFDVHYWELGNEPDVDPSLVPATSAFGCWGDIADPYYGGERYGQMLQVVAPAIRAEDPRAVVVLGGLLLDKPETTDPALGRPELFLEGILWAGGGAHFDILAFHAYPSYTGEKKDYDLHAGDWTSWGGLVPGKALYLRQTMAGYGLDKPLFLDETGLMCNPAYPVCVPAEPQFFEVQASHVPRSFVRGISNGIMGFVWYTLDGPGWRYTNLVEVDFTPKPVYIAYQALTEQLDQARYLQPVDYGPGLEAYAFRRGVEHVHIVWAVEDGTLPVSVPESSYVAAYDRDGAPITPPAPVGGFYEFLVGFEPVYLILED